MPANQAPRQTWFLSAAAVLVLLGSGCCGPMACGPMGGSGPISFGGRACGDGCNGCGELYVDEWINHPPSCNDPCDGCGNFNGQTCHACRPIFSGFLSLWGYRCDPPPTGCDSVACQPGCGAESCDGGCSSCGGGQLHEGYGPVPLAPEEFEFGGPVRLHPQHAQTHAPALVKTVPAVKPSQPQRSRQIFRPRGSVATGRPQPSAF